MKIDILKDGIYEVSDFVTKKDRDDLISTLELLSDQDWFEEDPNYTIDFWYGKRKTLVHPVLHKVNNSIMKLFETCSSITSLNHVCRYKINDSLGNHKDEYHKENEDNIMYGIVIYWNDDYVGGELYYPDIDFKIKPKAGSLILHRANIVHGTLPVESDSVRYFSTSFVRGSKNKPAVLKNIFKGESNE